MMPYFLVREVKLAAAMTVHLVSFQPDGVLTQKNTQNEQKKLTHTKPNCTKTQVNHKSEKNRKEKIGKIQIAPNFSLSLTYSRRKEFPMLKTCCFLCLVEGCCFLFFRLFVFCFLFFWGEVVVVCLFLYVDFH